MDKAYYQREAKRAMERLHSSRLEVSEKDFPIDEFMLAVAKLQKRGITLQEHEFDVESFILTRFLARTGGPPLQVITIEEEILAHKAAASREMMLIVELDRRTKTIKKYFIDEPDCKPLIETKLDHLTKYDAYDDKTAWLLGCAILRCLLGGKPESRELDLSEEYERIRPRSGRRRGIFLRGRREKR